jgi:hypothetical protein
MSDSSSKMKHSVIFFLLFAGVLAKAPRFENRTNFTNTMTWRYDKKIDYLSYPPFDLSIGSSYGFDKALLMNDSDIEKLRLDSLTWMNDRFKLPINSAVKVNGTWLTVIKNIGVLTPVYFDSSHDFLLASSLPRLSGEPSMALVAFVFVSSTGEGEATFIIRGKLIIYADQKIVPVRSIYKILDVFSACPIRTSEDFGDVINALLILREPDEYIHSSKDYWGVGIAEATLRLQLIQRSTSAKIQSTVFMYFPANEEDVQGQC